MVVADSMLIILKASELTSSKNNPESKHSAEKHHGTEANWRRGKNDIHQDVIREKSILVG